MIFPVVVAKRHSLALVKSAKQFTPAPRAVGIALLRQRLWAGYWLVTSIALIAFLAFVHFVGFSPSNAETPHVIAMSYRNNVWRILALIDLFSMFAVLAALAFQAVRTRQHSGRW